jgi:hypothetical protein
MGYGITLKQSKFYIDNKNRDKALSAIKRNKKIWEGVDPRWVKEIESATTLEDALWCLGWDFQGLGEDGKKLQRIFFVGENLWEDEKLFRVIAPYVKSGSYIEMFGEDGEQWRWCFEKGKLICKKPKITWVKK